MDAYCHKKHIMEEVEIERQKVNRRIGKYFFSFAAVSFLFSLSPPEVDHDQAPAYIAG
jgi:hypothetical protein